MNIDTYDNYIFDFDGTIVDLDVDWTGLKKEVVTICEEKGVDVSYSLNKKIDVLKAMGEPILKVVERYEQPDGCLKYCPIDSIIKMIQNDMGMFTIVSDNLSSTITRVLFELGLMGKCKCIIGIDNNRHSKPDRESFDLLRAHLNKGDTMYIGDRETDRMFARNAKIDFILTENLR